jgi:hypothetical protein
MDATIPFHFHTKSIFYTRMLLTACFDHFTPEICKFMSRAIPFPVCYVWCLDFHTNAATACDISAKCMGAGSTPKLPVAGVAVTCTMPQKLLVLHWHMAPSAEKMVSVEPGYPDYHRKIYLWLWTVASSWPMQAMRYIPLSAGYAGVKLAASWLHIPEGMRCSCQPEWLCHWQWYWGTGTARLMYTTALTKVDGRSQMLNL